jgi:hypothetical protein
MERRKFTREFKLEAMKLIQERVSNVASDGSAIWLLSLRPSGKCALRCNPSNHLPMHEAGTREPHGVTVNGHLWSSLLESCQVPLVAPDSGTH